MKALQIKVLALALLAITLGTSSCNNPKKLLNATKEMRFKTDPETLEVRGDSVEIRFTGKFPPKTFSKNAVVKFQPILQYGEGGGEDMPLKPMFLKGENVKTDVDGKTIKYASGGSFTYTDKIPFDSSLINSTLALDYTAKYPSKYEDLAQCASEFEDQLSIGTVTTALSVKPTDDILSAQSNDPDKKYQKVIFYYVVDEGFLRDSVGRGPATARLREIANDKKYEITDVRFQSYASPDGELERNDELTRLRAQSALEYTRKVLLNAGAKELYDSNLVKQPDVNKEDWPGFANLVRASSLPQSQKDELLRIATSSKSAEEKEKAMRSHTAWPMLKKSLLPKLRRTEVIIEGTFPDRNLAQMAELDKKGQLDSLTRRELLAYSNSLDNAGKARIFQYYGERYPADWAGPNNYAALILREGKYQEANDLLEELTTRFPENDTVTNNLGVAKRFLKKYNEAKEKYQKAQAGGIPEGNNLGILYIKYGDYESAIESFPDTQCDYNSALAYTLATQYEQALERIDCNKNKNASIYYLRAIVGARTNDRDLMTTSLSRAIDLDSEYKERAQEDLEFRRYRDTAEFRQSINR